MSAAARAPRLAPAHKVYVPSAEESAAKRAFARLRAARDALDAARRAAAAAADASRRSQERAARAAAADAKAAARGEGAEQAGRGVAHEGAGTAKAGGGAGGAKAASRQDLGPGARVAPVRAPARTQEEARKHAKEVLMKKMAAKARLTKAGGKGASGVVAGNAAANLAAQDVAQRVSAKPLSRKRPAEAEAERQTDGDAAQDTATAADAGAVDKSAKGPKPRAKKPRKAPLFADGNANAEREKSERQVYLSGLPSGVTSERCAELCVSGCGFQHTGALRPLLVAREMPCSSTARARVGSMRPRLPAFPGTRPLTRKVWHCSHGPAIIAGTCPLCPCAASQARCAYMVL